MTVQNTNTKNIYVGNGSTTVFPFTFYTLSEHPEYIKVYITGAGGVDVLTENYTIDMQAQNITYPKNGSPLKQGEKITIARELPLLQDLNLVNQGPFLAEVIEEAFDKCIMLIQQAKEKTDRTLLRGVSVDVDKFDAIIPIVPGKTFRVNDDGTALEAVSVLGEKEANAAINASSVAVEKADVATHAAEEAKASADKAYKVTPSGLRWAENITIDNEGRICMIVEVEE